MKYALALFAILYATSVVAQTTIIVRPKPKDCSLGIVIPGC